MNLINFIAWVPELIRLSKFVVDNYILIKSMKDTTKGKNINDLYQYEISNVAEMLKFNSKENLEKVYFSFKEKMNTGKYTISEKIVFEAVKKLLFL